MSFMYESAEQRLSKKLAEEKEYLWDGIKSLEKKLSDTQESLSQLEKSAPEHYSKVVGARNKVTSIKKQSEAHLQTIHDIAKAIEEDKEKFDGFKISIHDSFEKIEGFEKDAATFLESISSNEKEYRETKASIDSTLVELEKLADEKELLADRITSITEQVETSETLSKRLKSLLSNAADERNEISEIHKEIFGYTFENEGGEVKAVDGLQKTLESSYQKIKEDLSNLNAAVVKSKENQEKTLQSFDDDFNKQKQEFFATAESQKKAILDKISSLLPSAMTAGLSAAYADKIKVEQEQLIKHESSFKWAIVGLIICSSIPVAFTLIRVMFFKEDFSQVFDEAPSLFSMMLPLYAPILWVAYSSNKNYKLSKRLIEEYTHKEVSSRTFEGLSTQISSIGEDDTSGELRTRLLFNLLQVNSENPGKLISDYNNSDHPIIDAIDKSSKLADSIKKLDNVPVVSQLLKHLSAREQAKVDEKIKESKAILEAQLKDSNEENHESKRQLDS